VFSLEYTGLVDIMVVEVPKRRPTNEKKKKIVGVVHAAQRPQRLGFLGLQSAPASLLWISVALLLLRLYVVDLAVSCQVVS